MKKKPIILLFSIMVLLLLLFSCDTFSDKTSKTTSNISIPPGYLGAFGEGSSTDESEAENVARKIALQRLSEQIYVELQTESTLKEELSQIITNNKLKETAITTYENIVKTKSYLELSKIDFNLVEKRFENEKYYVKVLAIIDKTIALNIFNTYLALKTGKALLNAKMIYSAYNLVNQYETLLQNNQQNLPPKTFSNLTYIISQIKIEWSKLKSELANLEKLEISNTETSLRALEIIDRINNIAIDVPEELLEKYRAKTREYLKNFNINISGPSKVSIGQRVDLKISLSPAIHGSTNFIVKATGATFPKSVTLINGSTILSGLINDTNVQVTINLGNVLIASWSPGTQEGPGIGAEIKGELIRISSQGVATIDSDIASARENALKNAIIQAIKKGAGIVFSGNEDVLLNVPIDESVVNTLMGIINYEVINEKTKGGLYYIILNVNFEKQAFSSAIKKVVESQPPGYTLLLVENDEPGYVTSTMENLLLNNDIKLVSDEYSKKILKQQLTENYNPEMLAKLAILTAAQYVLNVKVHYGETYVSDYQLWSVRLFINVQVIRTQTGEIIKSENFEDVIAGATKEAAISKIVNNKKYKEFVSTIAKLLKTTSVKRDNNMEKTYTITMYVERPVYALIIKDYISKYFDDFKIISKDSEKIIFELTTKDSLTNVISIFKDFIEFNIILKEQGSTWAIFEMTK